MELEAKNKDFGAVSQRNLTKVKFRHWRGLIAFGLPKQSRQAFSCAFADSKLSLIFQGVGSLTFMRHLFSWIHKTCPRSAAVEAHFALLRVT